MVNKEKFTLKKIHLQKIVENNNQTFINNYIDGSLAQRLEQFAHNELVVGSNPTRPTINLHYSSIQ